MDEVIVSVDRIENIKKEYTKKFYFIVVPLICSGIFITITIDDEEGRIGFDNIGILIFLTGLILLMIGTIKPSLLRIAEISYHKTTLTTKWEYKEFKETNSKKEDWKR